MPTIIKRRKARPRAEFVPDSTSDSDLRDESNRRMHAAGYCDRDGQPLDRRKIRSKAPTETYRRNYVRIFGDK